MKKRLICAMMSLAMAVMVATPVMAAEGLLKGDANGNDIVDRADLDLVKDYILDAPNYAIYLDAVDMNGDGKVDLQDYVELQKVIEENDIKGDVNGDKYVNRTDLALLKEYLLEDDTEINAGNADVNNDGKVNLQDYIQLQKMVDEHIKGDVNNDGVVDQKDYDKLTAYLADPENNYVNQYNSDINGDCQVTEIDLQYLTKMLNGEGMTY